MPASLYVALSVPTAVCRQHATYATYLCFVCIAVFHAGGTLSDLTLTLCHVGEGTLPALRALPSLGTLELHHCTGLTAVAVVAFCALAPQVRAQL